MSGLTEAEMLAIKEDSLGGEQAAKAWRAAYHALHVYAQLTGRPLGRSVTEHFDQRTAAYLRAISEAVQRRDEDQRAAAIARADGAPQ